MKGRNIAILGLGRSGLAIATAALELGARSIVFDENPEDKITKHEAVLEARSRGIQLVLGYRPEGAWFALEGFEPDLVVTNPAVPKWHPGLSGTSAEVISEVEFAYRISKAPIVAITGTNGKSTTTVMTYLCLRACGLDAVLCGNIFGSGYPEMPLTEAVRDAALGRPPDRRLQEPGTPILVAEISSFQLEWVNSFAPIAAAITNISPDHLDRYDSFEEYVATKQRIHAFQSTSDYAVDVGYAPPVSAQLLRVGEDAHFDGDHLHVLGQTIHRSDLFIFEDHNYTNACTAALLAVGALRSAGREPNIDQIFQGLRDFRGLAHRMERLGDANGVQVINNSMCTNPAAVINSAAGIPPVAHLLLGGTNKKLDFEPLSRYLQSTGHRAYIFGSDAEQLHKMLGQTHSTYVTMEEAFKAATDQAKPGDTIMLAPGCASTDQFRDFRHRGDVFKAIAMEWLNQ